MVSLCSQLFNCISIGIFSWIFLRLNSACLDKNMLLQARQNGAGLAGIPAVLEADIGWSQVQESVREWAPNEFETSLSSLERPCCKIKCKTKAGLQLGSGLLAWMWSSTLDTIKKLFTKSYFILSISLEKCLSGVIFIYGKWSVPDHIYFLEQSRVFLIFFHLWYIDYNSTSQRVDGWDRTLLWFYEPALHSLILTLFQIGNTR